jgi:AraC family transcriptional regulator of adaptative response / DNA-3-methyladenine glycosylase II
MATTTFLPTREPFDGDAVLAFLAARAIEGVEEVRDGTYRRTLALPGGGAVLEATPGPGGVDVVATCEDAGDEDTALARCRRLFALDVDPGAVLEGLGADPLLGPLVRRRPGLRIPGVVDGWEIAARAVLGQQISVAAARRLAGRITAALGEPLSARSGALTHRFPTPESVVGAPADAFPMPRARTRALRAVAAAGLPLEDHADAPALLDVWGVGPWTAGYVALRLGDPDVFLAADAAVLRALRELDGTLDDAARWVPWRSFAVLHLWASLTKADDVARRRKGRGPQRE